MDVTDVTIGERYACCLYWAFGVMTQLMDRRECVRDVANDRLSRELQQVSFMLVVFLIGLIATSTIFGVLAELVANIGQETARYRKQIDVLNELFKSQKLPQKLYQKVRDYVEAEFAQTKGVDVASACSDLPPRLQIEIFFHLNRKLVMHVPLFTRLPSDWIDAMVMQMQFSFFVSGTVVIEEETVSDCCYYEARHPAVDSRRHGDAHLHGERLLWRRACSLLGPLAGPSECRDRLDASHAHLGGRRARQRRIPRGQEHLQADP